MNPTPESEPIFEKISPTAQVVAHLRAFSDIPYSQEIARATRAKEAIQAMGADPMVALAPIIEARFIGINNVLETLGIKSVLEIASGVSPRGLIMTVDPAVTYVQTDLPMTIHEAQQLISHILSKAAQQRPNLHFREADVFNFQQLLSASDLLPPPVAIVNEGLFQYMDRRDKLTAAKNIGLLLEAKGGVWITSDFVTKTPQDEMLANPKVRMGFNRLSDSTDTEIEDNVFADDRDVARFLGEAGFDAEEFDLSSLIDRLSSIENSGADRQQIIKILKGRKIHILKPHQ